jgi:hypothetical protein
MAFTIVVVIAKLASFVVLLLILIITHFGACWFALATERQWFSSEIRTTLNTFVIVICVVFRWVITDASESLSF